MFLCTVWLTAQFTYQRTKQPLAAWLVAASILTNLYAGYFFTIIRNLSIATFFFMLGLYWKERFRSSRHASFIFAGCCAAAAACRLTFLPVFIVVLIYLLFIDKKFWAAAFGLSIFAVILAPFVLVDPDAAWFNMFGFHIEYRHYLSITNHLNPIWLNIKSLHQLAQRYFLIFYLIVLLVIYRCFSQREARQGIHRDIHFNEDKTTDRFLYAILVFTLFVSHLITPQLLTDHFVVLLPLCTAFLAEKLALKENNNQRSRLQNIALNLFRLAILFQFLIGATYWWIYDLTSPSAVISLGEELRSHPGETILTERSLIALYSGKKMISGLEARKFGYMPNAAQEECAKYHRMNRTMLYELIAKRIPDLIVCDRTGIASYHKQSENESKLFFDALQANYHLLKKALVDSHRSQYLYVFEKKPF